MPYITKRDLDAFRCAAEGGYRRIPRFQVTFYPCRIEEDVDPLSAAIVKDIDIINDVVPLLVDRVKELQGAKGTVNVNIADLLQLISYIWLDCKPVKEAIANIEKAVQQRLLEEYRNNEY